MAGTKQIHEYNAAVSIDPAADYFLIDPGSTGNYLKINRNVSLGLTSAPLGTTDTQSPQNKTFDNTNSLTVKDGSLTIQNSSSTTKQAVFSAASITAGQTRTFTFPDASGTLVTASGTQTLTNKTLTSPVITGGTMDNTTITVDSISGYTSGTIVTVANLQISNGVLNSANAVTATSIAAGAIQPQALTSGTGSGWVWQTWSPTYANLTVGNGTVVSKYIQIGKTVFVKFFFTLGSTSVIGTTPAVSFPVTPTTDYVEEFFLGTSLFGQTGTADWYGVVTYSSATPSFKFRSVSTPSGSNPLNLVANSGQQLTATVPFTWAATNNILTQFFYECQ